MVGAALQAAAGLWCGDGGTDRAEIPPQRAFGRGDRRRRALSADGDHRGSRHSRILPIFAPSTKQKKIKKESQKASEIISFHEDQFDPPTNSNK